MPSKNFNLISPIYYNPHSQQKNLENVLNGVSKRRLSMCDYAERALVITNLCERGQGWSSYCAKNLARYTSSWESNERQRVLVVLSLLFLVQYIPSKQCVFEKPPSDGSCRTDFFQDVAISKLMQSTFPIDSKVLLIISGFM